MAEEADVPDRNKLEFVDLMDAFQTKARVGLYFLPLL